jgi:hypothetical protein
MDVELKPATARAVADIGASIVVSLYPSDRTPLVLDSLAAMRAMAVERLRPIACVPPARAQLLFHGAVLPSLRGSPAVWELFAVLDQRRSVDRHVAVRTEWNAAVDRQKLSTGHGGPEAVAAGPTMHSRTFHVAAGTATKLIHDLSELCVPVIAASPPRGMDGTAYRLVCGDHFARASVEWWSGGPGNWTALTTAFHVAWGALEALSDSSDDASVSPAHHRRPRG